MRAQQIMTQPVITVGADTSIVEAARIMLQHHVSGLPVVDASDKLIGILSQGDFVRRAEIGTQRKRGRWLSFLVGKDRIASEFVHQHGRTVGEIMTPDPVTVTEETPLDRVVQLMESHNVKRLPVMRGTELIGIVTRSDFVAALADLAPSIPAPSADDDQLRGAVTAAIRQTALRPCRLKVTLREGIVDLRGVVKNDSVRQAVVVAAENVPGVGKVQDHLSKIPPPLAEEDLGGGDFVSLQEQPSTLDDEPL